MIEQTHFPVAAEFHGQDEWSSPGLSYEDYERMYTHTRKLDSGRRYATPAWALNDLALREIITRYVEARVSSRNRQTIAAVGNLNARLEAAQKLLAQRRPMLIATLDGLSKTYVAIKNSQQPYAARLRSLQVEIENLDTQLIVNDSLAAKLAGVIHLYFRMGFNSVATADELGLKPPHVRQMCYKMAKIAESLGYKPEPLSQRKPAAKRRDTQQFENEYGERIKRLRREGKSVKAIADECGSTAKSVIKFLCSQGLYQRPIQHGPRNPPIGKKFGHWTVTGPADKTHQWTCRCDCGETRPVYHYQLVHGTSKSCGCRGRRKP